MKKTAISRLLAVACAFALLLSGCGGTGGSSAADNSTPAGTTAATDTKPDPFGVYDPAITFTYAYRTQPIIDYPAGDSLDNNVWTREMQKYGINMDVIWSADDKTGDYDTKLTVAMASGDLPDVFMCTSYNTMYSAYQAGLIADITDVFNNYASDYVKNLYETNKELFQSCFIDGKMVAIPALGTPIEGTGTFLWIRQDWMENLGLEAPKSFEDVIEIARAFTYNDPDGNGKNDTYGLGLQKDFFNNSFGDIMGVAAAYGTPTLSRTDNDMWFKDTDGTITNGSIQPGMKEALQTLQNMYAEGLLDPEFGVKDGSALAEDVTSGKIGMYFGYSGCNFYPNTTLYNADHNAIFKPYAVPAAEGHTVLIGNYWPVQGYYMVSSSYEHPEVLIKLLNINKSINNENITKETSAVYTDNSVWMLAPVQTSAPTLFSQAEEIWNALDNNDGGANISSNECRERYNLVEDFIKTGNNDNYQYGWWGQFAEDGATSIIVNDYIPNNKQLLTTVIGAQPDSMIEKLPNLLDMREQAFTEIIKGGSIDQFDAFVENWKNAGGTEIMKDLTEIYG